VNKVVMALVASFAAIGFGQPDPAADDAVDSSQVDAVSADHPHAILHSDVFHSASRCVTLDPRKRLIAPLQLLERRFLLGNALRRALVAGCFGKRSRLCLPLQLSSGWTEAFGFYAERVESKVYQ
jgi:hypothetical protein